MRACQPLSFIIPALSLLAMTGCSSESAPDAYGNVEAIEVVVSAQAAGQLTKLAVTDGQRLDAGAVVGSIDATELAFQRDQANAQRAATASRVNEVARQVPVLEAQRAAAQAQRDAAAAQRAALESQLEIARRNFDRTERLFAQQAATAQQLDQAEREYRTLQNQVEAQDQQIQAQARQVAAHTGQIDAVRAQRETAAQQVAAAAAQVQQLDDRLRKTQIANPLAGTVLVAYVKEGEVVQPGQPLYKIANLAEMDVRAYVTQGQLASVHVGGPARINFDVGDDIRSLDGTVTWVSSQAEFTPTPIQTRDERADLVYAIKVRVKNPDGMLKIGMPVDVNFGPPGAAR